MQSNFLDELFDLQTSKIVLVNDVGVESIISLPSVLINFFFFVSSFPCPWYQKVPLSLALSPRIISEVARFKPDIIHASSPGIMVNFLFFL